MVAEVGDAARAKRNIDERKLGEEVVALCLHQAAADGDDRARAAALHALGMVESRVERLVGLLADRAGVEHDDIGVLSRIGGLEPLPFEHAGNALTVVGVHLAAEGGDVIALHCSAAYRTMAIPARLSVSGCIMDDHIGMSEQEGRAVA